MILANFWQRTDYLLTNRLTRKLFVLVYISVYVSGCSCSEVLHSFLFLFYIYVCVCWQEYYHADLVSFHLLLLYRLFVTKKKGGGYELVLKLKTKRCNFLPYVKKLLFKLNNGLSSLSVNTIPLFHIFWYDFNLFCVFSTIFPCNAVIKTLYSTLIAGNTDEADKF